MQDFNKGLFTFHYASTLSIDSAESLWKAVYLHSTMLLLYRWIITGMPGHLTIYIPLCFYFIKVWSKEQLVTVWFTFHYASTLS